jgi:hypothetical protein
MIACCGLECTTCDAYKATATNDDALRVKVATEWSAAFKADIKPEQIQCTGCKGTGVHFLYCESMCEIRKCAGKRGFGTCAECPDYACATLQPVHDMACQAKENLERLRAH